MDTFVHDRQLRDIADGRQARLGVRLPAAVQSVWATGKANARKFSEAYQACAREQPQNKAVVGLRCSLAILRRDDERRPATSSCSFLSICLAAFRVRGAPPCAAFGGAGTPKLIPRTG